MSDNKVAIIIGASRGIGEVIADSLASNNYNLILGSRSVNSLETISKGLKDNYNVNVDFYKTDVSNIEDIENLIKKADEKYGRLDCLVNSQGISLISEFGKHSIEEFQRVMYINFESIVHSCNFSLPYLKKSEGFIFNVSSGAGLKGYALQTAYSASKFALNGFTEALDEELKRNGARAFALCPGFVDTELGRNHASNLVEFGELSELPNWNEVLKPKEIGEKVIELIGNSNDYNSIITF